MGMKTIWFDTETTGLDPAVNEITQFAAIIVVDGVVKEEANIRMQPSNWDAITPEALAITGVDVEELKTFQKPQHAFLEIQQLVDKHVDKFNKHDKYFPAGHNVSFDIGFVQAFFKRWGDDYGFGSYQNWQSLDTRVLANFMIYSGLIKPDNTKLETLCEYFGIDIQAHDAMADIRATRTLASTMMEALMSASVVTPVNK